MAIALCLASIVTTAGCSDSSGGTQEQDAASLGVPSCDPGTLRIRGTHNGSPLSIDREVERDRVALAPSGNAIEIYVTDDAMDAPTLTIRWVSVEDGVLQEAGAELRVSGTEGVAVYLPCSEDGVSATTSSLGQRWAIEAASLCHGADDRVEVSACYRQSQGEE